MKQRKDKRRLKADSLFVIYWQMGNERSIKKLSEICFSLGVKTSESSLHKYSQAFDWQRRIIEMDKRLQEVQETKAIQEVMDMNRRHVQLAQGMMGIAFAGMKHLHQQVDPDGLLNLSVDEIVKLFREGQRGERLARGQATSRVEIWTEVIETVVKEFGLIFIAVNEVEGKERRQDEFIRLADDMVRRYYRLESKEKGEYERD